MREPERLCVGCGKRDGKRTMIRFTASQGVAVRDSNRPAPGRGAYLHPREGCAQAFVARKPFIRSLGKSLSKAERARFVAVSGAGSGGLRPSAANSAQI